ncbi:ABC transporter substrate-binding protein [Streptomyces sulfonofaciens]|uniref:ABC transporter substrate-binding protein n=1 Tax=Streptomyces sulfonofaciens TaxID=68272 RepID=A0A919GB70_9ACTN|nr:ABC transporter substrate-binding protein [Streptomyces sulfonofaciens]GHH81398.1 ABC transporter substrate-binding protein [Streptomyces sulfonofaciens]
MTWEFTDDREVTVRMAGRPLRVAAYLRAGAGLFDLGVRPVGVYGSAHDGARPDPAKSGALAGQDVPYLGAGGALDERALRSVRPDLIVDVTYDREHAYAVDGSVAARAGIPVLALAVSADVPLTRILGRFAELGRALGGRRPADLAGDAREPGAGGLAAAEDAVRTAALGGPGPRVLALSAAGPDRVHLARPRTWPELRHLADLGVRLVEPGPGGVNWSTTTWEAAAGFGADVILADSRGNAVRPADLARQPGWRAVAERAVVVGWNPELPGSPGACAAFLRAVADGLAAARDETA